MWIALRLAALFLVVCLAGCDGGADDGPPPMLVAGEWAGTVTGGGAWDGQVTLSLGQSADRPVGRATWTDGTRTRTATVGGYAPAGGPALLRLDFGSVGEVELLVNGDRTRLSGRWGRPFRYSDVELIRQDPGARRPSSSTSATSSSD